MRQSHIVKDDEMAELKEGTVVQLKSGGPRMTCKNSPKEDGEVHCQWFDGKDVKDDFFPVQSLRVAPERTNRRST